MTKVTLIKTQNQGDCSIDPNKEDKIRKPHADFLGKRFPLFVSSFLVLLAKKVGMCACIKQDEDKFLFAYFPDE